MPQQRSYRVMVTGFAAWLVLGGPSRAGERNILVHSEDRITELISRLDENPDILHTDHTPAVHDLVNIGRPALPALLEVMVSAEGDLTRLRAQTAIELITMEEMGFDWGHGWQGQDRGTEWRAQWRRLGNLNWQAPQEDRERSVELWREWLETSGESEVDADE